MSKQMPVVEQPSFPAHTVSISDFGAVGDGSRLNTEAMQQAIDACAAAGGGTVVIPAGLWLTGPLELRSRIRLHAEKGAVIAFSRDKALYPLLTGYWEGQTAVRYQPTISGSGLMDIAITGEGVFDGNGDAWRPVKDWKMTSKQWSALLASGGVVDLETNIWWPDDGAMPGGYLKNVDNSSQLLRHERIMRGYFLPHSSSKRSSSTSAAYLTRGLESAPL
ncbi:hypothetical protein ASG81_19920 [Paenibacillus sp. Soil522]|nr:hypothetical protein ASG81_19920 [Paenibacillus sp. Soil522]